MQTVLMAAGQGTRMRPLTDRRPKPMLPVADRPLLAHIADTAIEAGASKLVIVLGHEAEAIRSYFGAVYRDTPIRYAEQTTQQGTADAVRVGTTALDRGPFVVINGDILMTPSSLDQLYERMPAVLATRVEEPSNYGVFRVDDRGEHVEGVIEKPAEPPSQLANAGAYGFPAEAQQLVTEVDRSERGEYELTDVLQEICTRHRVVPVETEQWLDVGRPWELLEANEWKVAELSDRRAGTISPEATLEGTVTVESGATIREGVTIQGPVLVREGADIGPTSYLRGPAVIGRDATVGHGVEIKRSVLFEGATVGHQAYVGDSILGRGVNFGAGTNVANLRHDGQPVRLRVKGEAVSTGRRKFGVVIGDGVKTSINTSLNAGVVLGTDERTTPGEAVLVDRR